jgi:hypothetical protein
MFDVYIESISERSKGVAEKNTFYGEEPFTGLAYPDSRKLTLVFAIYDVNRRKIAKDLKQLVRSRHQFFMWIDGIDIVDGFPYVVGFCDNIQTPNSAESPEVIKVIFNVTLLSVYDFNNVVENNYVSVKYLSNVWDLEGAS